MLGSNLRNKEQLEEEQQEVSREEDHPCVPGCEQAEGESVCGVEPAEAPVTSQPLPRWLPGKSPGHGSCCSRCSSLCCIEVTQSRRLQVLGGA